MLANLKRTGAIDSVKNPIRTYRVFVPYAEPPQKTIFVRRQVIFAGTVLIFSRIF
jgi:hypothetical protein